MTNQPKMAIVQLLITLLFLILSTNADVTFDIENASQDVLWIGIQANPGQDLLKNGGFVLNGGETVTINSPDSWAGRFWGRTGCDSNTNTCQTGDCGQVLECGGKGGAPPVTLVEIKLKGDGGQDFYDVSLVDGFNIEASIQPIDGTGDCQTGECLADVNSVCPDDLKVGDYACNSACNKYNTDQYCCRGDYGSVDTCKPDDWEVNSAAIFKQQCPKAYSYAFDDQNTSLFACMASHYHIKFGG